MKEIGIRIGLILLIAIFIVAGWYFLSPLFLDRTIDEGLPFDLPTPTTEATPDFPDDDEIGEIMPPTVIVTATETVTATEEAVSEETPTEESTPEVPATVTLTETVTIEEPTEEATIEATVEITGEVTPEVTAEVTEEVTEEATPEAMIMVTATIVAVGDAAPSTPIVLGQGQFVDGDNFHKGSGVATLYKAPDSSYLLRFDDFTATNGPDLHVILSPSATPYDHASLGEYLDLGALKGNIGDQNYTLPADFDPTRYKSVVIYCLPFQVIFATATLQ